MRIFSNAELSVTSVFLTLAVSLFGVNNAMADLVTNRISVSDLRELAHEMSLSQARAQVANYTFRARRSGVGNQFFYMHQDGRAYFIAVGLRKPIEGSWSVKRSGSENFLCTEFPGLRSVKYNKIGPDEATPFYGHSCRAIDNLGSPSDPLTGIVKEKAQGDIFNMRSGTWPFKQVGRSGTLTQVYGKFQSR